MNVLFRCDGNLEIGAGHLVRCGALAREITQRGGHAALVCRAIPENLRWATAGATTIPLEAPIGTSGGLCERDRRSLLEVARRWQADWIFVDHYGADAGYLGGVWEAGYRLAVLDDAGGRDLRAANLVVNPNLGAESIPYADEPQPNAAYENCVGEIGRRRQTAPFRTRLRFTSGIFRHSFRRLPDAGTHDATGLEAFCLGPAYAALRPEFAVARQQFERIGIAGRLQRPVEQVFVGFGGSHLGGVAGEVVDAIRAWEFPPRVAFAAGLDAAAVASAMSASGLAISASGSTVWELCCLGVPSVIWPVADNQRGIAEALDRIGAAVAAQGIGEALVAARELICSPERRVALGEAAWGLVDGRGAARVVDEMQRRMGGQWGAKVSLRGTDSISGAGEIRR